MHKLLNKMGKVINFLNNKGGVGKTTSAYNIGVAWAEMGKKILFIDLDSQSNLTSMVSKTDVITQKWDRTLEDAFIDGPESGLPIYGTDDERIDYVPTDLDLSNFERDTARTNFRELLLKDLIEPVKDSYDFIIIDCPPNLSMITYNAMIASDYVVLVTNPDGLSFKGTQMCVNLYNEIINYKRFNPDLTIIGVLVTRYEKDKIADTYMDILRNTYRNLVINPVIRKNTKIKQATSFNQSIYALDQGGRASTEYRNAAMDLFVRIQDDAENGQN